MPIPIIFSRSQYFAYSADSDIDRHIILVINSAYHLNRNRGNYVNFKIRETS